MVGYRILGRWTEKEKFSNEVTALLKIDEIGGAI